MFKRNDIIDSRYEVMFPIQDTTYGSSYRVKGLDDGRLYMIKIYEKSKMKDWQFDKDGNLIEAKIHKTLSHPNIANFISCDKLMYQDQEIYIYVVDFISGETLQEKIDRDGPSTPSFATNLVKKIIEAVSYLHNQKSPIIHADITPVNIMLDMSSGSLEPILFDFGLSKIGQYNTSYNKTVPSVYYCSNETLIGKSTIKSDIFSIGALLYTMIEGFFPWHDKFTIDDYNQEGFLDKIIESRNTKLIFSSLNNLDETIKLSIIKSLSPVAESRFKDLDDFKKTITKEKVISSEEIRREEKMRVLDKKSGEGFSKVAGMNDLKRMIQEEVIDPLKDPESFKDYGIDPPNGVLFYGPPGCGKTFFAECLSEEIGFNFMKIGPSDVGSKYVHGGQEKIQQLFKSAKENAPTILFLDEIDAMIPDREGGEVGHHYASEVNEWLVQFNNCGEQEVFIIAATNKMNKLDSAILRSGRFDRKILVPIPDFNSRKAIFELYLNKRKKVLDDNIDIDKLSDITSNFVCSDIKLLVNDAARIARKSSKKITQDILLEVINNTSSSLSIKEINRYSQDKKDKNKSGSIGFKIPSKK